MCNSQNLFSQDKNNTDKYEIDKINITFKGKKSYDSDAIKNLLASKEGDEFVLEVYMNDVERIKKFYFDNGYFDATVDTGLVFKKDDEEVNENFIIKENGRYRYYEIHYIGLDSIDASTKERIFRPNDMLIREGGFYSKDTIKLEALRILNLLNNNGYATALAENPEVLKYETNDQSLKHKVNLNLRYLPKLKYVFGPTKITFKNNKYNITDNDVRRELTYHENQIYNKEEVVNSEINLAKITLIENPRITIAKADSVNKKIYLAINAVISNKYELTPEIFGYYFQNVFYIGTGVSFIDKYFFGGGRFLNLSGRYYFHSFKDYRFEFVNSILQPFLFNNRNISGNWDIGFEYRVTPQADETHFKNTFGISYDLPAYTYINKLSTQWQLENTRVILKEDIVIDTVVIEKFDINYFTSILRFAATHNSVNNIQFPFKGYYQSYELAESGLLGGLVRRLVNTATISFVKFTNFNSFYQNLSNRETNVTSVLAGKISAGVIFEYGDNTFTFQDQVILADRVPTDEKFVCGGAGSVRGWGARQLGIVADKYVGGNFIVENSVENRFRPFIDVENTLLRDLGFATFMDIGNVWSEIQKFKWNELALAAGGGIRYYTIIGAIRLDLGFKIYDPQPGPVGGSNWIFGPGCNFNDKYNLQFGIGNTF